MQEEDVTPRFRVFLKWLKANFISVLITAILLVAATLSVTYAYLNGKAPEHVPDQVSQIDVKSFAYAPVAESIPVAGSSESTSATDGGAHSGTTDKPAAPSQQSPAGETLGASVSCKEIEKQASSILQETLKRGILLPSDAVEDAYGTYAAVLKAKGCTPALTLNDVLGRLGGGIVGSLRALL